MAKKEAPKGPGRATLENVRTVFRNFSGKEGQYNRAGDRNFAVLLPEDVAQAMEADGWNVKYLPAREEGESDQAYIKVKLNYGTRPPTVVMIGSRGRVNLSENEVGMLDWAQFKNVDLIISPYHYNINGRTGVTAYLHAIYVTVEEDALEQKYADIPDSAQSSLPWQNDEPGPQFE